MWKARAFTLIEMLVVSAIVAILAGLLVVALSTCGPRPKKAVTKLTLRQIDAALQSYNAKYNDYPPSDGDLTGIYGAEKLFDALNTKEFTPLLRDIRTCLTPSGKTVFADAWNQPFRYLHHKDYDNKPPNKLEYRLISVGPNGIFENGAANSDDIGNWEDL